MFKVVSAAVMDGEGGIWCGTYHGDAIGKAQMFHAPKIRGYSCPVWDVPYVCGFMDSEGEFLNREQAHERAVLLNQLPEDYRVEPEGLHAADLKRKPEEVYNL